MNPQNLFNRTSTQPSQPNYGAYQPGLNNAPNKRLVLLGLIGGIILVIIFAMLLLSGGNGGSANQKTDLANLINSQNQIVNIVNQYQTNISSDNLSSAAATAQIAWQSAINSTTPFYNSLSKKPLASSTQLDAKLKQNLDSAQQAGNLDSAYASSLVNTSSQIKNEVSSLSKDKPSTKLLAELQRINSLADNTIKQISPFASQ